jgi:hypothetical protein
MRKKGFLGLIFEMAVEAVKKYRVVSGAFLGEYLRFMT